MQINKSFKLRDDSSYLTDHKNIKQQSRKLTKPKSPTFATTQRMQLKDDMSFASAGDLLETHSAHNTAFKARPFNKKVFDRIESLPTVEKKKETKFTEFSLSKSNCKLGKKTFTEYVTNKENACVATNSFRAKSLDKKMLDEPDFKPCHTERKRATEQSPF